MSHHLSSALPSSPGNGLSLCKRSLQPPVPSSSRCCPTLRRPAADTGVLLLWAPTGALPCGVHGHVPAPVARSPLELHPAGLPRRRVVSQEAAGSWLLPTAGKRPGTGHSNFQPRQPLVSVQLLGLKFPQHKKLFYGAPAEGKPTVPPPRDPWVLMAVVPWAACPAWFYSYKNWWSLHSPENPSLWARKAGIGQQA